MKSISKYLVGFFLVFLGTGCVSNEAWYGSSVPRVREISPGPSPTTPPLPINEYAPKKVQDEWESNCNTNYSGCVPVASDVDCAGGSGNGPAYVSGPVRVLGSDVYDLDRDGDGIGCE